MPWQTPTLDDLRRGTRDAIMGRLPGADATLPNSILRVLSDVNAGNAYQVLAYLDRLSRELLPDSALDWLDRHGQIWLGGRKPSTFATGTISLTGTPGRVVPAGTRLQSDSIVYATTAPVTLAAGPTPAPVEADTPGAIGNRPAGGPLVVLDGATYLDGAATVILIDGGFDEESDEDLRARVLRRIRQPPMGGCGYDYEAWALEVPGVTRAWCAPLEMGPGTVTVRFMMDGLRALQGGFPGDADVAAVRLHVDVKRPVAVKDFFVVAPIPHPINLTISGLVDDSDAIRAAIAANVRAMLRERAKPGQTIYRSWVGEAVSAALGEDHHELTFSTTQMPSAGHLATLGSIVHLI